jgi:hypothetical protein
VFFQICAQGASATRMLVTHHNMNEVPPPGLGGPPGGMQPPAKVVWLMQQARLLCVISKVMCLCATT